MRPSRQEFLGREQRWAKPVAITALLAVAVFVASGFTGPKTSHEGDAALLQAAHAHSSGVALSGAMEALAFVLLAFPLVYLFRAIQARAERIYGGMVGLLVLGPLCLAISTGLGAAAKNDAASQFVAGEAKSTLSKKEANKECASQLKDKGAKSFREEFTPSRGETPLAACERREIEDDEASNVLTEASLVSLATVFGIAGGLSLIAGLFYTSLWAMRTGMLGRFWASLGMALGITVLLGTILFLLLWFAYLGLLIAGWLPKGRPPAWAAGEAIPWPTPGEKAAAGLSSTTEDSPQANGDLPPPAEEEEATPEKGQSQ